MLQLERLGHKRETQTHGPLRSGIVTTVTTEGKGNASDLGIRLRAPADGQTTATIRTLPVTSLKPGATVQVLVDPQDPGYAEFPGQPGTEQSLSLAFPLIFLMPFMVMVFGAIWTGRAWLRQRRTG